MSHDLIPVQAIAKLKGCTLTAARDLAAYRGYALQPIRRGQGSGPGRPHVGLPRVLAEIIIGRAVTDAEIEAALPRRKKATVADVAAAVAVRDAEWMAAISAARARAANAAVPLPDLVLPRERYPVYNEGRPDRATQMALNSMEHRHAAAWRQLLDRILSSISPELKA